MRFRRRRRIHVLVRSKRTLLLIWIVIVCIFGSLFFLIADMKLRPIIREMALTRAQYLATRAINDAVTQEISRHDAEYTNLVIFEKDADNRISALKTDVIKVNQLKTSVTDAVLTCLGEIDTSELSVPLGNAIGGGLLSGRGPRIPRLPFIIPNISWKSSLRGFSDEKTASLRCRADSLGEDGAVSAPGGSLRRGDRFGRFDADLSPYGRWNGEADARRAARHPASHARCSAAAAILPG